MALTHCKKQKFLGHLVVREVIMLIILKVHFSWLNATGLCLVCSYFLFLVQCWCSFFMTRHGSVYLCGHLHTLAGMVRHMYTKQKTGYLELELADWKDSRVWVCCTLLEFNASSELKNCHSLCTAFCRFLLTLSDYQVFCEVWSRVLPVTSPDTTFCVFCADYTSK